MRSPFVLREKGLDEIDDLAGSLNQLACLLAADWSARRVYPGNGHRHAVAKSWTTAERSAAVRIVP
jgi:hypothetical protein